jgi:hypothetical protein
VSLSRTTFLSFWGGASKYKYIFFFRVKGSQTTCSVTSRQLVESKHVQGNQSE